MTMHGSHIDIHEGHNADGNKSILWGSNPQMILLFKATLTVIGLTNGHTLLPILIVWLVHAKVIVTIVYAYW